MGIERLLGGSIGALARSLALRVQRGAALAANVANADTPGYRRVDVEFLPELERAAASLARTSAAHIAAPESSGVRVVQGPRGTRPDRNGVDRDAELVEVVRNAGEFGERADVLARVFTLRRIAATSEPR
jgi:flagellar basal-body rod protein FlgB